MTNSEHLTPEIINSSIAIIGMSGRFPGAKNIDEFWQNLKNGVESISFFSDSELLASGIDPSLLKNPAYVRAKGVLSDIENFDAYFFGFNPREAEITDVQHRIFLECAWEALESAGYDPERYKGLIGVYAGTGMSTYLLNHLLSGADPTNLSEQYQAVISNDKDFLTTMTSYKLNLKGPSICIQTACSTSLVAVHIACQGLLNGECDMALAGGVSVDVPHKTGYLYQEGMILSPDGHCRAFDAQANGTVGGNGCGIVVLKRLEDALADKDMIYAIIRGSAVNNDGALKVGFTAPGVDGQAAVISEAYAVADIDPSSISYIETHGTGTPLGDPIEISALTQVFGRQTQKKFCAIGSIKTNMGHLNAAAGVSGLIKTTLAINHRMIPPSLNCEQTNPKIDFENSPFFVNTRLSEWKTEGNPRRAGVSSFGIGGTNAHVVVEEMQRAKCKEQSERVFHLLVLSAKTETALDAAGRNLADYLKKHPEINLADAAYTLQVGRKAFGWKQVLVCRDTQEAIRLLEGAEPSRVFSGFQDEGEQRPVFMFSGQGAQYVNMGLELYRTEPFFRQITDQCSEILKTHIGIDLREILYPDLFQGRGNELHLTHTSITQPALFVIEYALAKLWNSWGITPSAMIGHSIGEYVAACLSGVFSLEDALNVIAMRGKMMGEMPEGAMLAIMLPENETMRFLNKDISLAAVNAPSLCVVSGITDAIDKLQDELARLGIGCQRLHTSHAFHSEMMSQILNSFSEFMKTIRLNPPRIPYISNVSGTWITAAEAADPQYWANHLRQTVRFSDGVQTLLNESRQILLELGPGRTLSQLAMKQENKPRIALNSLKHPQDEQSDILLLYTTLGRLWLSGIRVDWTGFYRNEPRCRIPLPTYPFERRRCWIDKSDSHQKKIKPDSRLDIPKDPDIENWLYLPSWQRTLPSVRASQSPDSGFWLILADSLGLGNKLIGHLGYEDHSFSANPDSVDDYDALFAELDKTGRVPKKILYLRGLESNSEQNLNLFYNLLFLAQSVGKRNIADEIELIVISDNIHDISGHETELCPEKSAMLGLLNVIRQEIPNMRCRSIDVSISSASDDRIIEQLAVEIVSESDAPVIAFRGNHRWVQTFTPLRSLPFGKTMLKENGVYLITGGLGGIGLVLAAYLAKNQNARLVLTGRTPLPPREQWSDILSNDNAEKDIARKIKKVMELESFGAEVLAAAVDVSNLQAMKALIAAIDARFGKLDGVIHAAGITGAKSFRLIQETDISDCEYQFQPKVHGLIALEAAIRGKTPDFCILMSSLSSVLGGLGFAAYSAANIFMDAFAQHQNRISRFPWISVNWDGWKTEDDQYKDSPVGATQAELAITPEEGIRVLEQIVSLRHGTQIIVSTGDLHARIDKWIRYKSAAKRPEIHKTSSAHARPNLPTPYIAPRTEPEKILAEIFQTILGFDQVGISDNFFYLGGDSLLATQVASRIREKFKIALPLSNMFIKPTVESLAELITRKPIKHADQEKMTQILEKVNQMPEEDAKKLSEFFF
jgi:acyl transferase domain-containing protein/acyl carrier protein